MRKDLRAAPKAPPVPFQMKPEPTAVTRTDEFLRLILLELRELNQRLGEIREAAA